MVLYNIPIQNYSTKLQKLKELFNRNVNKYKNQSVYSQLYCMTPEMLPQHLIEI